MTELPGPFDARRDAPRAPTILDAGADARFRRKAEAMGLDPDDHWVGGYAAHEWNSLRHLIGAYAGDVQGARLLEFGCNYGGSCIVAAALGAVVSGIDVDADTVELARLNAERHGLADRVDLRFLPGGSSLPFPDAHFDIVQCISVLEYVGPADLPGALAEIRRVLRPGGIVMVSGTASRLAPREVHSGRWLVNYWPAALDRWLLRRDEPLQRGANPLTIMRAFRDFENLDLGDRGARWIAARAAMGQSGAKLKTAAWIGRLIRPLGLSIGMVGASFSAAWRKPGRATGGSGST